MLWEQGLIVTLRLPEAGVTILTPHLRQTSQLSQESKKTGKLKKHENYEISLKTSKINQKLKF